MVISIRKLAKTHKLRQRELAEILQTDQSVVSLIVNGHRKLTEDHIELLRNRFGDEELNKYIIPEEEVQRKSVELTRYSPELIEDNRNEARKELEDAEIIEPEEVEIKETVILTAEILTQEGIDIKKELKAGTLEVEVKPTQDVLPTHHAKVYTETDEMSPEIEANDPVFVRFLSNKRDFIDGRMYFVDLDNGSVVRWVVGVDADNIRLISMKDERTVPFDRVRSISEVVAITKRPKTLPKERVTFDEAIARKDNQIDTILDQNSRLIGIIEKKI